MAAKLQEAGMVALSVATGCAVVLEPLLSFLEGAPARGHVLGLDAAILFVTLTLPMAFLVGVILIFTPTAGAPMVLAAFRQYVLLVCALLVLLSMASLFPAAGSR